MKKSAGIWIAVAIVVALAYLLMRKGSGAAATGDAPAWNTYETPLSGPTVGVFGKDWG